MKHLLHKRPIPILLTVVLLGMIPLMFFSAHALFGDRSGELYTITWLVDGVAYEDDYASGELPEPPAGIVADFADEQYVYTFDYWLCEDDGERGIKPVTQSTTYSAVFKVKETRKYTVTWCNWDGSVLNVDEVEYGKIPEYMHEEPIKPSENQIAYVWDGWYPTPMMVQGNQTYTAVFSEEMEDGWHEIDGKYYYYMGGLLVVNDFVRLPYPDADVMPGYARDEEDFRVNQLTNPANTQRYEYPDGESAKFMIGEDGALCTEISGTIIDEDGAVRWIQNGMLVWHAGLVRDGSGYRYFKRNGMVKGSTVYVAKTNGLLDPGTYSFDENGFLIECVNNRFIQEDIRRFGMENIRILPQKEWRAKCYYKLALRDEQEVLCRLAPVLTERYRGVLSFAASESNILDVQCYGRNKAVMLRELADSFASPVRLIAVGDYDNDLEMLSVAALPCCPANAVEAVKKICRRCLCSNDEGAIADLIDWLDVTPDLWKAP